MSKPTRTQPPPASTQKTSDRPLIQQKRITPAAPPAYRPQRTPKVLQPKAAAPQVKKTPAAPPAYQPQPAPKCLQAKAATPRQPIQGRANAVPLAPKVLQAKTVVHPIGNQLRPAPAAPPVYRARTAPGALQKKSAGAHRPAMAVAAFPIANTIQRKERVNLSDDVISHAVDNESIVDHLASSKLDAWAIARKKDRLDKITTCFQSRADLIEACKAAINRNYGYYGYHVNNTEEIRVDLSSRNIKVWESQYGANPVEKNLREMIMKVSIAENGQPFIGHWHPVAE